MLRMKSKIWSFLRTYDKNESRIEVRTYCRLIALVVDPFCEKSLGVKLLLEKVWDKLMMDLSLEIPLEILLVKNLSLAGF